MPHVPHLLYVPYRVCDGKYNRRSDGPCSVGRDPHTTPIHDERILTMRVRIRSQSVAGPAPFDIDIHACARCLDLSLPVGLPGRASLCFASAPEDAGSGRGSDSGSGRGLDRTSVERFRPTSLGLTASPKIFSKFWVEL